MVFFGRNVRERGFLSVALVLLMLAPAPAAAQSRAEAQLAIRVQELEELVRALTGQVEGLQFTVTEMQTQLQRMHQDNEFRFQQIEGGAPKKLPASDPAGGAGTPVSGGEGAPLDLNFDAGDALSNGDAEAQLAAGRTAMLNGDYVFAADQFRQFVALYPNDRSAPDAVNWLGESLLQQRAFDEAAAALLAGFKAYESTPRGPEILFNLGLALAGAGEVDAACRTYLEVEKRYGEAAAALAERLAVERHNANCPS